MHRPNALPTGQWPVANLPLDEDGKLASGRGYDGP